MDPGFQRYAKQKLKQIKRFSLNAACFSLFTEKQSVSHSFGFHDI
ncbi:hypothetical protein PSE_4875 [Pseudovibrio sp. FO-BEG1]|nr:hypothetical protein PSE_4875 [Pseudovibrio sp. FO-BEG1]